MSKQTTIAVIGLGYVGLPLAVEFGKRYKTIGFDLSEVKVVSYMNHCDPTGEVSASELKEAMELGGLEVTTDGGRLASADFLIIAVPTPVNKANYPDFSPLVDASITVGRHMKPGATVVYESTVYPGATEEICIPILERESGLKWMQDFHVGYSPERINPGDKQRTISKIVKVVSADDAATLNAVSNLYESIIAAGVYRASCIKVAEAAKVIENTQRDLNIALMNELAIIFDKLGIDTQEVLDAAGTKWNFMPFRPGLVGGHCIGVDPYYLTHKAEMLGYHPQVILAGRKINDGMAAWVARQTLKQIVDAGGQVTRAKVIVLGLTFKENCPDLRNSKSADLVRELQNYGCEVFVHDFISKVLDAQYEYGITLTEWGSIPQADAVIVAVPHQQYLEMPLDNLLSKLKFSGVFIDIKSAFPKKVLEKKGVRVWRL